MSALGAYLGLWFVGQNRREIMFYLLSGSFAIKSLNPGAFNLP